MAKRQLGLPPTEDTHAATLEYIWSRGTDLVTNGTGFMGDNTNFSLFDFVGSDAPTGAAGSFITRLPGVAGTWTLDELLPVDPNKKFLFSFYMRQTGTSTDGRAYAFLAPYDAFKQTISPQNYMYIAGTTTTLAAPLNPGDTTITLTSAANWYGSAAKPAGGSTHLRSIIFWDYTDPGGKTWPAETYSRNFNTNLWDDGAISGNVITLRSAWAGSTRPAGTAVSNGSSGGSYMYGGISNGVVPQEWTRYPASIIGLVSGGNVASFAAGWPPGVAFAKIGWLLNRTVGGASDANSHMAVAGVSLSDAAAAQVMADEPITDDQLPGRLKATARQISGDWNSATETGFYRGNNLTNAPGQASWYYVEVMRHDNSYVVQTAYDFFFDRIYTRRLSGGVWQPWVEVSLVGHTHTSAQISDATSAATANMIAKRDASGRLAVASPSATGDAATKGYVDLQAVSSDLATAGNVSLNTLVTPGSYMTGAFQTDLPISPGGRGNLRVEATSDGTIVTQIWTSFASDSQTFVRSLFSGVWSAWSPLDNSGSLVGERGREFRVVSGVIRNPGTGWEIISDSAHGAINVESVSTSTTGITINYPSLGASKVVSAMVTADETLGKEGFIAGASVGLTSTVIQLTSAISLSDYVAWSSGTTFVSANGVFDCSWASGILTLTHRDIPLSEVYDIQVTPRVGSNGALLIPSVSNASGSISTTTLKMSWHGSDLLRVNTPSVSHVAFVSVGGRGLADPTRVTTSVFPNSNLWFYILLEV